MKAFVLGCATSAIALTSSAALAQAASAPGEAQLDEVIVSALRRESSLQEVPLAVSVVSGETLQATGVTGIQQLGQATPSLNLARVGNNVIPTMRGVGTNNSTIGDDPNVAIYVDGVYRPSPLGNDFALAGIEHIEVLKGPQGTLFGRNAEGGAILITTRSPSFSEVLSEGSVSYGERASFEAKGFASTPLSDTAAVSFSALYNSAEGFAHNLAKDKRTGDTMHYVLRPKIAIQLSDRLRLDGLASYSYNDDASGFNYTAMSIGGARPAFLGTAPGANLPAPTRTDQVSLSEQPYNKVKSGDASIKLTYDGDAVRLSSQTSYTFTNLHNLVDGDQGPLRLVTVQIHSREWAWQQEFLASSVGESRLDWVTGLFLYKASATYDPFIVGASRDGVAPLALTYSYATPTGKSVAPFAEVAYKVTDNFKLTLGARYTWEEKAITGYSRRNGAIVTPIVNQSATFEKFTPRVVFAYDMPGIASIYASYSKGFKSGTYNSSAPSQPVVQPETLDAYEVGVKSLFSPRWRVNLATFYEDYKDIQMQAFAANVGSTILSNAAVGRVYGAEFELHGQVSPSFSIDAFTSYTNTKYTSYTSAVVNSPRVGGFGLITHTGVDISGSPFIRTPKWTAGLTGNYNIEFTSGKLNAMLNAYYRSTVFWDTSYLNETDGYTILNGEMGWTPAGSRFIFSVFGRNLTDKLYTVGGSSTAQTYYQVGAEPRTLGVRMSLALD